MRNVVLHAAFHSLLISHHKKIRSGTDAAGTPTNCAERTAVFKAVSEGITEFDAIAVCGGPGEAEPEDFCTPCGVCRQVLREFVDPNEFLVLLCKGDGSWKEMTLEELLPMGFGKENL